MSICSIIGSFLPTQVSGSSTSYEEVTIAGSLKANIGVVTPRTVKPMATAVTNRRSEGSGVMNSTIRAFIDSFFRRNGRTGENDNRGRNIDKLNTAGSSIAKRVIQGFTWTGPKQPQDSAPVMPLYSVIAEKTEKHSNVASQAAFLNRPESSQMARASSNSTVRMRNGLYDQMSLLATGSVSNC